MDWKREYRNLAWIAGIFVFTYFMPVGRPVFDHAVNSALSLTKWYAQEHVLLCLVPAFFIAGVIAVFISQAAVIKYFGAGAKKWLSYLVASVSGTILAVCSCTILPLFSGIHKRGAGLGPAIAFLYSGPAINILAIILTARILGFELGIARVAGAVFFAVVIGLLMHFIYRKEETAKAQAQLTLPEAEEVRPLWKSALHFFILVFILIFATWGKPAGASGFWAAIYHLKWLLVAILSLGLGVSLVQVVGVKIFHVLIGGAVVLLTGTLFPSQPLIPFAVGVIILTVILSINTGVAEDWMAETWGFTKQILPLLGAGVAAAGFLLGDPSGGTGVIPSRWITNWVGGNSVFANFFASITGAFMYFATLTEVPILQGLLNAGMGKGPALALLLAGPALSLPNMLVIRQVIGTQKTLVYVSLVVVMATVSGLIYGSIF